MIQFLDATQLQIFRASDGAVQVKIGESEYVAEVQVLRAFPLSHPTTNIVLRDGAGQEIGIIPDLDQLNAEARAVVDEALERRYFLPKITRIESIFERFGSSIWEVDTDRGAVTIQTKAMNESVTEIGPGRFILRDNEENRYEIPNLLDLDEVSRSRFLGKV